MISRGETTFGNLGSRGAAAQCVNIDIAPDRSGLEPTRIRGKPDGAKQGRAAADVKLTPENPVQTLYWLGAATLAGVIEASLHFDITVLVVILCRFLVTFPRRCSNRNQGKVHALSHGDGYALSASVLIGIKRFDATTRRWDSRASRHSPAERAPR